MAEPLVTHEMVLEQIQLRAQAALSHLKLYSMAENVRVRLIEDYMAQHLVGHLTTLLWGSQHQDVYFQETVHWTKPATWWDHLLETLARRLEGLHWRTPSRLELAYTEPGLRWALASWLRSRIRYTWFSETVTDRRKVATRLCPHVSIPTPERQDIHLAWLNGNEDLANEMREEWECRGPRR